MKQFLNRTYNIDVLSIQKLGGYDNENFLIKTENAKYIFKTYNPTDGLLAELEAETEALSFLNKQADYDYPQTILTKDGYAVMESTLQDKTYLCRLLTYVKGELLGDTPPSEALFKSFGNSLAKIDQKLFDYKNTIIEAKKWHWDNQYYYLNEQYIDDIPDLENRKIVEYFFHQYEEKVNPVLSQLRKSIIHNDANEFNVLTQGELVSGFIDFSDMSHTYLINEVAIAMAYTIYDEQEPLKWANVILKSYNSIIPLEPAEISVLYYLIAIRLCVSVCNSHHAQINDPTNMHALVSQKTAWRMLQYLYNTNGNIVSKIFFEATKKR